MSSSNKRRKLFVDPAVQGSLARRMTVHWFMFFGIVVGIQFLTVWMLDPMMGIQELTQKVLQNNGLFLGAIVLLLPSFVYDTVKLSHRFAGPMVRLRNAFKEIEETGELKEIAFRDGDFWLSMADSYNGMIQRLQNDQKQEPNVQNAGEHAPSLAPGNDMDVSADNMDVSADNMDQETQPVESSDSNAATKSFEPAEV